jgi:hypothetical protein
MSDSTSGAAPGSLGAFKPNAQRILLSELLKAGPSAVALAAPRESTSPSGVLAVAQRCPACALQCALKLRASGLSAACRGPPVPKWSALQHVSAPIERIYDLALRSLDEQERQLGELRGRLAPVVAAGGLGITLLARPVFRGSHPEGPWEVMATIVGLAGAAVLLFAVAYLLRSRPMAFSVDAVAALDAAREADLIDDAGEFDEAMARALAERRAGNAPIVERLHTAFTTALYGLLFELGGLSAAAALAS